jgi:hypothetical protein
LHCNTFNPCTQDFKAAHLLGVPPSSQLVAMLLGSAASVPISVAAFKLYTTAWQVGSVVCGFQGKRARCCGMLYGSGWRVTSHHITALPLG